MDGIAQATLSGLRLLYSGHLDFDEAGLDAEGFFHAPQAHTKPQWMSIFKLSETPDNTEKPKDWFEFDGRRWGSW